MSPPLVAAAIAGSGFLSFKGNMAAARAARQTAEYNAQVEDSYGNTYDNYFEYAHEANDWIYYVWEKEEWFNSVDSHELLEKAIQDCIELDKKSGILTGNRDGLD